ncbi:GNAT family N-acetyltransferase [Cognatishimia sp.]|uniref:GNAT family N-acetyltransferase n=2 Tax=Cognatishimia sp. TaxID=2211648 RepID=UPI003559CB28
MIRAARAGDEPALLAFLQPHLATSMFLAGNLLEHGLFEREHRHGTEFWVLEDSGSIQGVFGATMQGYLMVQCPDGDHAVWQAFAQCVAGRLFRGITGDAAQVEHVMSVLGIHADDVALDALDPLMFMDLSDLPDSASDIRAPSADDWSLLKDWWRGYLVDAGLNTADDANVDEDSATRATVSVQENATRILTVEDQSVAMSSINARVKNMVQIGGVYTPRHLRGQGFAGRVIAAHMTEERGAGVKQAILFAASEMATKAYEKIGFTQIGHYRLFLAKTPVRLGGQL